MFSDLISLGTKLKENVFPRLDKVCGILGIRNIETDKNV